MSDKWASETHTPTQGLEDTWRNFGVLLGFLCPVTLTYAHLVFTKSVDRNFLRTDRKMARRFAKVSEEKIKTVFLYPSDLVNTKTTIPLRVGEERWICTSTLRVSVYIHHYSPPLREIVVYYFGGSSSRSSEIEIRFSYIRH